MAEKFYFMSVVNADLQKMMSQGLGVTPYSVQLPVPMHGFAFAESERRRVFEYLKIPQRSVFDELPTNEPNIYYIQYMSSHRLSEMAESYKVEVDDLFLKLNPAVRLGELKNLCLSFASAFGKHIYVHASQSQTAKPIDDDGIHLFCFAKPEEKNVRPVLGQLEYNILLGVDFAESEEISVILNPSQHYPMLIDEESGCVYAQLAGRNKLNLFILVNVVSIWNDKHFEALKRIMTAFKDCFGFNNTDTDTPLHKHIENRRALLENASSDYVKFGLRRATNLRSDLEHTLRVTERDIQEKLRDLGSLYNARKSIENKLQECTVPNRVQLTRDFEVECEALRSHQGVEKFWIRGNKLEIFTPEVIIDDRVIGRFKVVINPYDGKFFCINLDRRISGFHHPHVRSEANDVCFGVVNNEIRHQILLCHLLPAFNAIWGRLNMYTENNCYVRIDKYPHVNEIVRKKVLVESALYPTEDDLLQNLRRMVVNVLTLSLSKQASSLETSEPSAIFDNTTQGFPASA